MKATLGLTFDVLSEVEGGALAKSLGVLQPLTDLRKTQLQLTTSAASGESSVPDSILKLEVRGQIRSQSGSQSC